MTTTRRVAAALTVLAVLGSAVALPGVVAASHEDGTFVDDLVDSDSATSVGLWLAKRTGTSAKWWAAFTTDTEGETASEYAADLRREFNAENESIGDYANDNLDASTDRDVFRVCTNDQEDGHDVVYLVSNASSGEWRNERMVTADEFSSLNRSVDYNVSLDWYASRNADEELDAFVETFAEPGENLSATYRAKMVAQYGDSVESDLWGQDPEGCPA